MSAAQPNDLQQEEEDGDHIQVKAERSKHVLLRRYLVLLVFPTHDNLRVKHQILWRETQRASVKESRGSVPYL